ncbi:MAG: hypothetical protein AAF985_24810, partial [Bacteroidota bacterium]
QLNRPEFMTEHWEFGANSIYGFTLYGGNDVPTFEYAFYDAEKALLAEDSSPSNEGNRAPNYKRGDQKTFNHLAISLKANKGNEVAAKAGRFYRRGVLRMDVDGLGWQFSEGIKKKNYQFYNLPTYAALSRNLDTFFVGFLNTIWKNGEWSSQFSENSKTNSDSQNPPAKTTSQLKHLSQIIYSGGDDLFIVGRWDACLYFAKQINHYFKKWTGQDQLEKEQKPRLSISGGLAMLTAKFPIIKGAEFAADAEKAAKDYKIGQLEKNAFTLWKPLNWDWEYPQVEVLKNRIEHFMQLDKYRSIFHRILSFYKLKTVLEEEEQRNKSTAQTNGKSTLRWKWLLAYNLSRSIQDYQRKDRPFADFLREIQTDVFANTWQHNKTISSNKEYFDLLQIAIRWADFEYRTYKN